MYALAFVFAVAFQCKPVDYAFRYWRERGGTCVNGDALTWALAAINIAIDVAVIALPLHPLSKLKTTTRRKLLISVMFSCGFL
jgi:hypothetical protein